jgi:hypothetical protein
MKSNQGISRSYVLCPWIGDWEEREQGTDGEGRSVHCSSLFSKGLLESRARWLATLA